MSCPCRSAIRTVRSARPAATALEAKFPHRSRLRFKISKTSDRLGDIDPNILCRSVRIPDESCYAAGVEDAIKITTGGLGRLAVFDLELVGIVSLFQTFCSFVRILEEHRCRRSRRFGP
jgi:hypothetical protein